MIVKFTPTEGDTRTYEFRPLKMHRIEAQEIERLTGMDYRGDFLRRLETSTLAQAALVYVFEKRAHPTLSWAAFDFPIDAVEFEPDAQDIAESKEALLSGKVDLPPDEIAAKLAEVEAYEASLGEPAPKSPPTATSTAEPAT